VHPQRFGDSAAARRSGAADRSLECVRVDGHGLLAYSLVGATVGFVIGLAAGRQRARDDD
jgi:hypothetical protein